MNINFSKEVKDAVEAVKLGIPVVLVDDDDREFEGDLVLAAEKVNFFNLQFLFLHGRGLMCLPCTSEKLDQFEIPMQFSNDKDLFATPFATGIDAAKNVTTGMSLEDRLETIQTFVSNDGKPEDLSLPGHLFPLRASENLLQDRQGHTEGTIELLKLADVEQVGIIVEMMDWQGQMIKGDGLERFAKLYNLPFISIEQIKNEVYN
jgi:3,4-dihydroxy-2-butanone 4-phosphate synthase|tara:strand:- start:106 stop:720 length:615 start_codon:yes stop_codon:yes gene_type:complete